MSTGKFCWHDLMSTDPDISQEFFTKLFGWDVRMVDMGPMGMYRMIFNGEDSIGGIIPLEANIPVPSHWVGYVMVDDVDAALERAANAGGRACVPGTDIPEIGRFGVLSDPSGAVISPFAAAQELPPEEAPTVPTVGSFCWNELLTNDVEGARAFYGEVFGWDHQESDMGEMEVYTLFRTGEFDRAGALTMPENVGAPPHWLGYILVEDIEAKAEEVTTLGGKVHCGPMDIPGIGRFAACADPTGAGFALFKAAPKPDC